MPPYPSTCPKGSGISAPDAPTTVTWEIEETMPGVCKLTVVHEGLVAGSATLEQVSGGWPFILSGLKTLLETGKGLGEE